MRDIITPGPGGAREGAAGSPEKEWVLYFKDHLVGAHSANPQRLQREKAGEEMPLSPSSLSSDFQQQLPICQVQQQEGKESMDKSQGSTLFFCKGSDSKCFRLFKL